jgi:hypothetical protein
MGLRRIVLVVAAAVAVGALATVPSGVSAPAGPGRLDAGRTLVGNRDGLAARDNRNFGAVPDTSGAIGRRHYLEAVIPRIALFDARTLKLVAARDAYAFWGKSNRSQIIDPNVVWDDAARRWYYTALFNGSGGKNNQLLLAWTKRGDPSDLGRSWCRMAIRTGKLFADFPKLGFSRTHIVIGTNLFITEPKLDFLSARIWAIGKPARGRNTCARPPVHSFGSEAEPLRSADGHIAFTPVAVAPSRPGGSAYVVAADCIFEPTPGDEEPPPCSTHDRTGNQITVWHVDGPRNAPKLSRDGGIDVPRYEIPTPAPQRGARRPVDTSDTRLYQAVSAPDPTQDLSVAIWTQHAVDGPGRRSEVRWYELDPQRLEVVRRGTIQAARDWVFSGAISPTARGDRAMIHFVVSGPDRTPVLRARSRGPHTPPTIMGDELTVARSASAYACDVDPGEACPWGDYAAATPDPVRRGIVWGSNELVGSPKHPGPLKTYWKTRNLAVRPR